MEIQKLESVADDQPPFTYEGSYRKFVAYVDGVAEPLSMDVLVFEDKSDPEKGKFVQWVTLQHHDKNLVWMVGESEHTLMYSLFTALYKEMLRVWDVPWDERFTTATDIAWFVLGSLKKEDVFFD